MRHQVEQRRLRWQAALFVGGQLEVARGLAHIESGCRFAKTVIGTPGEGDMGLGQILKALGVMLRIGFPQP
jgi:hypothetical protein